MIIPFDSPVMSCWMKTSLAVMGAVGRSPLGSLRAWFLPRPTLTCLGRHGRRCSLRSPLLWDSAVE
jgi:hypothetical protein